MRETYPISSCERKRAFDVDIQRLDRALAGVVGSCSKYFQVCFFNEREGGRKGIVRRAKRGRAFGFDVFIRKAWRLFRVNNRVREERVKSKGIFCDTPTRGSRVASGIKLIVRFVCREPRLQSYTTDTMLPLSRN